MMEDGQSAPLRGQVQRNRQGLRPLFAGRAGKGKLYINAIGKQRSSGWRGARNWPVDVRIMHSDR